MTTQFGTLPIIALLAVTGATTAMAPPMEFYGIKMDDLAPVLIGAAGAVTSVLYESKGNWVQNFGAFLAGILVSYYMTPVIAETMGWSVAKLDLVRLCLGLTGWYIVGAVIGLAKQARRDPFGWVAKVRKAIGGKDAG